MADEPDRLPLPRALPEIRRLAGAATPNYRAFYASALDGRIPAEIGPNGRWTVRRADLPRIAAALAQPAAQAA